LGQAPSGWRGPSGFERPPLVQEEVEVLDRGVNFFRPFGHGKLEEVFLGDTQDPAEKRVTGSRG
jgi:hypothetical protein